MNRSYEGLNKDIREIGKMLNGLIGSIRKPPVKLATGN